MRVLIHRPRVASLGLHRPRAPEHLLADLWLSAQSSRKAQLADQERECDKPRPRSGSHVLPAFAPTFNRGIQKACERRRPCTLRHSVTLGVASAERPDFGRVTKIARREVRMVRITRTRIQRISQRYWPPYGALRMFVPAIYIQTPDAGRDSTMADIGAWSEERAPIHACLNS
ncbi:unnamed protein product [Peniophora sp. CBMAI 1063]|nr:unnamed protein product [Peniophora sp. CBMAI 1063]